MISSIRLIGVNYLVCGFTQIDRALALPTRFWSIHACPYVASAVLV